MLPKIASCIIVWCGKRNHITDDCTWLRQMKPVPKFVGYAARGLGVLLFQSSKDNNELENPNPMALITVKSRILNETQLLIGFNYMFSWGWQWRCKKNKELVNCDDFKLLGTGAMINIKKWAFDSQAVGKLHTTWVNFEKVPDCFRHFFGMCEVAASLGPVLEIDMDTITQEKIRAKVRVRDFEKTPGYTEITDKDLMNIYRIMPKLEKVVEMGWYGEHKRQHLGETGMDCVGEEVRKRQKNNDTGESNKENVTLGSMSLVKFEEFKRRSEAIMVAQQEHNKEREARKKVEADLGVVIRKMQELEEENVRQKALKSQDDKKIQEIVLERKILMDLVNQQQSIISKCVEKIERWEEREREMDEITEKELEKMEEEK
ncbi:hypothetical protein VPH35_048066 [Triticum aestivum]